MDKEKSIDQHGLTQQLLLFNLWTHGIDLTKTIWTIGMLMPKSINDNKFKINIRFLIKKYFIQI